MEISRYAKKKKKNRTIFTKSETDKLNKVEKKKKKNTNLRGKSTSKNRKERANDYFDAIGKVSNRPFVIKMDSLQRCLY